MATTDKRWIVTFKNKPDNPWHGTIDFRITAPTLGAANARAWAKIRAACSPGRERDHGLQWAKTRRES